MRRAASCYVALLHHPVLDRAGKVVTTAITNLDIHDIARSTRTFGLAGYFLVTPIAAQRELAGRIVGHWTEGAGRVHNDKRSEALATVRVVADLDDAVAQVTAEAGAPLLCATGARPKSGTIGFRAFRGADDPRPVLLLFGTGWGLAGDIFLRSHAVLAPIVAAEPRGEYNHLSVRSAVAIVLDRLFGAHE